MVRRLSVALAVLLFAAACSILPGGGRRGRAAVPRDSIFVYTVNENYYDVRIHAVYDGGQRHAVGTIPGNGGRAWAGLPWEPRSVEFSVFLVTAGTTYLSQPFDLAAGDSIELRVPLNISMSGMFRRVRN